MTQQNPNAPKPGEEPDAIGNEDRGVQPPTSPHQPKTAQQAGGADDAPRDRPGVKEAQQLEQSGLRKAGQHGADLPAPTPPGGHERKGYS